MVSVFAARYPMGVGGSKPYASATQTVSSPAFSSATTWSAASRGLPEYISIWESFISVLRAVEGGARAGAGPVHADSNTVTVAPDRPQPKESPRGRATSHHR